MEVLNDGSCNMYIIYTHKHISNVLKTWTPVRGLLTVEGSEVRGVGKEEILIGERGNGGPGQWKAILNKGARDDIT